MTKMQLHKLPTAKLKRIAANLNILIPRDYDKNDIWASICDRLGEDTVAWRLLDQWKVPNSR